MSDPVRIIAEAGVNHDGCLDTALALVDAAAEAGADWVKFQTFKAARLAVASVPKAGYQLETTDPGESQLAMLRRLELSEDAHRTLIGRCAERGIGFLSTPFDEESLDFLVGELDLPIVKIPSGEIVNAPLLLRIARTGRRIILSTGMATLGEVEAALAVLVWGALHADLPESSDAVMDAFARHGTDPLRDRVTLMHCTTEYPAPFAQTNLRAMDTLREAFLLPVGFSDHTPGIAVAMAAAARGATVIEKHFTLDRTAPGPDHAASVEPDELAALVAGVRAVEQALGDGRKVPSASELGNRTVVRKAVVAGRPIAAGEPMTLDTLAVKRAGGGLSPLRIFDYLGRPAPRDFDQDEPITA